MIKIKRPSDAPSSLCSESVEATERNIREIVRTRKPMSNEFPRHWGKKDVRDALHGMQHGKCCYCERKRDWNRESDIEHFRPKAEVTEAGAEHMGYWWLAYEWGNLFFSCRHCNQEHKKSFFPIENEANRAYSPDDDLKREQAYLIDPCEEEPETMLTYDWGDDDFVWINSRPGSEKGRRTWEVLDLNRNELLEERAGLLSELEAIANEMKAGKHLGNQIIIDRATANIQSATAAERRFAGFRRNFFRKSGLGEYVSDN